MANLNVADLVSGSPDVMEGAMHPQVCAPVLLLLLLAAHADAPPPGFGALPHGGQQAKAPRCGLLLPPSACCRP